MAKIEVDRTKEGEFRVTVSERGTSSTHTVTVPRDYAAKLTGGQIAVEELVRLSFESLLEREPKESILARFELPVISHYFPEYEREIRKRLPGGS